MPPSYLQYRAMHFGWWPSPRYSSPHRRRRLRATDLVCRQPRSRRRDCLLTAPWAAAGRTPCPYAGVAHCAATRWWAWGCHRLGRTVSQGCQFSRPRQMDGGRCAVPPPLAALWRLGAQKCWVWRIMMFCMSLIPLWMWACVWWEPKQLHIPLYINFELQNIQICLGPATNKYCPFGATRCGILLSELPMDLDSHSKGNVGGCDQFPEEVGGFRNLSKHTQTEIYHWQQYSKTQDGVWFELRN